MPVINFATYVLYRYEVQLTNMEQELNGSVFSCSISSLSHSRKGRPVYLTQWKGSARLFLENPVLYATESPKTYRSVVSISVLVSVFLVLVTIALPLVAIAAWRRKHLLQQRYEPAQGTDSINDTVGVPLGKL